MEPKRNVAMWAALTCSTIWAASTNPYSTVMAVVWALFAVIIFTVDVVCDQKRKQGRSNAK